MQCEYSPTDRRITTGTSRFWYANGIAEGLREELKREKKAEEEAQKRKLQRAKAAESKGEAYEESEDEDDGMGDILDFGVHESSDHGSTNDAEVTNGEKPKTRRFDNAHVKIQEIEREKEAAIVLADQNKRVQEEVLKENDVKVYAGAKRKRPSTYDSSAYWKGHHDSKEIDLKQRAIGEDYAKKVKRENI